MDATTTGTDTQGVIYFSVFTPVYNRKHTIHRVWESLLAQTYKHFEWIVVDDGSTDEVCELLDEYKTKADFDVIILKQNNWANMLPGIKQLK